MRSQQLKALICKQFFYMSCPFLLSLTIDDTSLFYMYNTSLEFPDPHFCNKSCLIESDGRWELFFKASYRGLRNQNLKIFKLLEHWQKMLK